MAITITNNLNCFDKKNLSIIFKNIEDDNKKIDLKKEGDFVFVFQENKIIGINVFNYENYFQVKDGFHKLDLKVKNYLLKQFPKYLNEKDFEDFYKIGKVLEKTQHPNSDKLFLLKVKFNDKEVQIITNVESVEVNQNYLFATNGSITYSGLEIKESKVLNALSQGMILSYKSIGIEKEGIINCNNLSIQDSYDF